MAQSIPFGDKITMITGTEEQINVIRQQLHELGIDIEKRQYIEFVSHDDETVQSNANSNQHPPSVTNQEPAKIPTSEPQPKPATPPVQNPEPKQTPTVQKPEPKQALTVQKSNTFKASDFKIEKSQDGFNFYFPDAAKEKINSIFGSKETIRISDPNHPDSNFFITKQAENLLEFTVFPNKYTDENERNQTLLKVLNLIE